ncbi:hypothetical protein LACR103602_02800 [Lactobacillus crispatus]
MCNQFRLPNLKQIQQYLKSDLDLPLVTPNFDIQAQDIFPNQVAPVLLYQNGQLQLSKKNGAIQVPLIQKSHYLTLELSDFMIQRLQCGTNPLPSNVA